MGRPPIEQAPVQRRRTGPCFPVWNADGHGPERARTWTGADCADLSVRRDDSMRRWNHDDEGCTAIKRIAAPMKRIWLLPAAGVRAPRSSSTFPKLLWKSPGMSAAHGGIPFTDGIASSVQASLGWQFTLRRDGRPAKKTQSNEKPSSRTPRIAAGRSCVWRRKGAYCRTMTRKRDGPQKRAGSAIFRLPRKVSLSRSFTVA